MEPPLRSARQKKRRKKKAGRLSGRGGEMPKKSKGPTVEQMSRKVQLSARLDNICGINHLASTGLFSLQS